MSFASTIAEYPVMESFYTIQGEGYYQGHAAYFIRLGGCDVGCVWCDVKESWDAGKHPHRKVNELIEEVKLHKANLAVITGGEPLLYDLAALTTALHAANIRTNIETSGSSPLSGSWNWICVSPKKFKPALPEVVAKADELKIVIYNRHDLAWAEKYASMTGERCRLYLQPEWSKAAEMLPLIIAYIKENPRWELSVQLHKYINVP